MDKTKLIKKSKYFKNLENMDFYALLRCLTAQVKTYEKNELIVHDGDDSNVIYIILQGYARSFTIDYNGTRSIVADFPKDSVFGMEYYLSGKKTYREHLLAVEDTVVLLCNSFRFVSPCQNRCKRHIDFMKLIYEDLARASIESKKRTSLLCINKTRDKIMNYLRGVKAQTRKEYFTIPFNRQEMAEYLGVERTALSAELSKLKSEGIIDYDKNSFKIIKKDQKGL